MKNPVLTVTVNPAVDVTLRTNTLAPRQKLRTEAPRYDPGGGGINVSRVIRELGDNSTAFIARGGHLGHMLEELVAAERIEAVYFDGDGMTRPSVKVFAQVDDSQFRFVPPGPPQSTETIERLKRELFRTLDQHKYDYAIGSGSLPPGVPDDFWARLAEHCRRCGTRLVLDTSGPPLKAAIESGVHIVKVNQREIQTACKDKLAPVDIARKLFQERKADAVVLTLGADGAVLISDRCEARIRAPVVEVRSTVGAGDTFLGAMMVKLIRGESLIDACRYGVAGSAATVTTEATELCHREDADRLFEQVTTEALT